MITDKRFDLLLERARTEAERSPVDAYARVFEVVLSYLIENDRSDQFQMLANMPATGVMAMQAKKTPKVKGGVK